MRRSYNALTCGVEGWPVTMDTIVPEAGTAALLPLPGRVVVVFLDMDTLEVMVVVLLVLGQILEQLL